MIFAFPVKAQFVDDFSDGDFTINPSWSGETSSFVVNDQNKLQLNAPEIDSDAYLSTPFSAIEDGVWEFKVAMGFATSSTSLTRVYLVSDNADLKADLNGYFVLIGDTEDEVSLYRQDGSSDEIVIDGADKSIEGSTVNVSVRVTRSPAGEWELFRDTEGGSNYVSEGSSTDLTYTSSGFFGVYCKFTSSRSTLFSFDDFVVGNVPDTDPPTIMSVLAISEDKVDIAFSEEVDEATAETTSNYSINNGISITSAERDDSNNKLVHLTTSTLINGESYSIVINNIEDLGTNVIEPNSTIDFEYLIFSEPSFREVVINELFTNQGGSNLVANDYLELFNTTTDKFFQLENWTVEDNNASPVSLGSFVLRPREYLIVSSDTSEFSKELNRMAISLPNFNENDDEAVLKFSNGNLVDSLGYGNTEDGISIEQINPAFPIYSSSNYGNSLDVDGGTPGEENSIFDDSPDINAPTINKLEATSPTQLVVVFSEAMDKASLDGATYSLTDGINITTITSSIESVTLDLEVELTSENFYSLSISNATDLFGNELPSTPFEFYYDVTPPKILRVRPFSSNVLEVYFNEPVNEPNAEDEDNFLVDNGISFPESARRAEEDLTLVKLEFEPSFSTGTKYSLTISNQKDTIGNETSGPLTTTFDFNNAIDTVLVIGPNLLDIKWIEEPSTLSAENIRNYAVTDDEGGQSDNSIGNPVKAIKDSSDPEVVHLIFSKNFNENDDLFLEVDSITNTSGDFLITPTNEFMYDTSRPGLDAVESVTQDAIVLYFDEKLDISSSEAISNYELNDTIFPVSAKLQHGARRVGLQFENPFEIEVEQLIRVDNIKDVYGNAITSSQSETFVYDPLPPRIDSVVQLSIKKVEIDFSETVDLNTSQNPIHYTVNEITPVHSERQPIDSSRVILTFADDISSLVKSELVVSGVSDTRSNTIGSINSVFNTLNLRASKILPSSNNKILVLFNKPINTTAAINTNYLINDIHPLQAEITADSLVTLSLDRSLESMTNNKLVVQDITSADGETTNFGEYTFEYNEFFKDLEIINEKNIQLNFNKSFLETPSTSLFSLEGELPEAVTIDSENDQTLRLFFDAQLPENKTITIKWEPITLAFGELIPANSVAFVNDTKAPEVIMVSATLRNQIIVTFNEPVEAVSAVSANHYFISSIGNPIEIQLLSDTTLLLTLGSSLADGTTYEMVIDRVADLRGNEIQMQSVNFTFNAPEAPLFREVVINEMLPDPDPERPFPNVEFIELFNTTSNRTFNLQGWRLEGAGSGELSEVEFGPGEYLILTSTQNVGLFNDLGMNAISWNSTSSSQLTNGGEILQLYDIEGNKVDSVVYPAATDGISIEQVNPSLPIVLQKNYGNAIAPSGNTAGSINSIFDDTPDITPPTLVGQLLIAGKDALQIVFSEPVDENTSEVIDNYTIEGITIQDAVRSEDDFSIVNLSVSMFPRNDTLTLEVTDVEDLLGNAMEASTISIVYLETEVAEVNDIIINEFMAAPSSDNVINEEFVELFNLSKKVISVEGWTLSDNSNPSSPFSPKIIPPGGYLILTSTGNVSLFEGYGEVLGVSSFQALNNTGDEIILKNQLGEIINQTRYSSSGSGISTEFINPSILDFTESNYGLSTATSGATPGSQNSLFDDTPDNTAPTLTSLIVQSQSSLALIFNELLDGVSAEELSNYTIDGGVSVSSARWVEVPGNEVLLEVSSLTSNELRTIIIDGVKDISGNETTNILATFEYLDTQEAAFGDIVVNEFMADPTPTIGLPEADFVELYNRSEKFIQLKNWKLKDNSTSTSAPFPDYIIRPDSLLIICDLGFEKEFEAYGTVIAVDGFPGFNATSSDDIVILNAFDQEMFKITYPSSLPGDGISAELMNPDNPCISGDSYSRSIDLRGGTPGSENSIFNPEEDITPPKIVGFNYDKRLIINFSEVMDALSLLMSTFSVSGLTIDEIIVEGDFPSALELSFEEDLEKGQSYTLSITGPTDCSGNVLETTTLTFGVGGSPGYNDLIITEIMFDPDPAFLLPEREFLEIFNASEKIISTQGLQFSDASNTIDLPAFNINPGEYWVLTSTSGAEEFSDNEFFTSANLTGVTSFPSFNNDGEQLIISKGDSLITSLTYSTTWYTSPNDQEGGVSLELIDLTNPCMESPANWGSSVGDLKSTPAASNSIASIGSVPDNMGPEVVAVTAVAADTIRVDFNEKIVPDAELTGKADFSPPIASYHFHFMTEYPKSIFISLDTPLEVSSAVQLSVTRIFDCSGNEVQSNANVFALPDQAQKGQILLSEVLFNPRSGGVDFVELYNNSSEFLSLKNWQLARYDPDGLDDEKILSTDELVIAPNDFIALTIDAGLLLSNYPQGDRSRFFEMSSFPTYSNDTGNVVLLNHLGIVQEHFHYEDDYHYRLLESTDGVSLERIAYDAPTNDPNNWRSASSTENFATPGKVNSQSFDPEGAASGEVKIDPKVFLPGDDGNRSVTTINYQFEEPGQFANVTIFDQTGRKVKTLVEGQSLATSGFFTWEGDTDSGGNARLGYYVVLFEVYDGSGNSETIKETVVVGRNF